MRAAILFLLIVLVLASPDVSSPPDDNLIVPGVRIGKWTLKMTIPDLERMNGSAIRRLVTAGEAPNISSITDFTVYEWLSVGIGAITYAGTRVEGLIAGIRGILVPHKTDKGIGVRGTRGEVLRAYGKPPAEARMSPADMVTIDDKVGIAFGIQNTYGDIFSIVIFRPGSAKTLWKF